MSGSSIADSEQAGVAKSSSNQKFCIEVVINAFQECSEEIKLENYIIAYKELYRFFQLMGNVFAFVASDVIEKIEILESLRSGENATHYASVESMINYEKQNSLLNKKNFVNGCRTLLRLHRALEFIGNFMQELAKAKDDDPTSSLAQTSYKSSLAKFHPWLLQKAAIVAMYTLPTKCNLIEKTCNTEGNDENSIIDAMKKMSESANHVYNITQKLYEHNELLNLP